MGMALALALAAATTIAPPGPSCTGQSLPASALRVLKVLRVVKGDDGRSHFTHAEKQAEGREYMNLGKTFYQTDFGAADLVRLVVGPPDVAFPVHTSPGREMFLTVAGETFVTLPDGSEEAAGPGTLVVMDDVGATGHGGRTGKCGYVALQIVPRAAAQAAAAGK